MKSLIFRDRIHPYPKIKQSPFEIFPVATWVLAIGLGVSIILLLIINLALI
jgi:hypothetical protein